MSWNDLSMAERTAYIKLGLDNGITNLNIVRDTYNKYAKGGPRGRMKPHPKGAPIEYEQMSSEKEREYQSHQERIQEHATRVEQRNRRNKENAEDLFGSLRRATDNMENYVSSQVDMANNLGSGIREATQNQRQDKLDKAHDIKRGLESTLTGLELMSAGAALSPYALRYLSRHSMQNPRLAARLRRLSQYINKDNTQIAMNSIQGLVDGAQFMFADNPFDRVENGIEMAGDGIGIAGGFNVLPRKLDNMADFIGWSMPVYDIGKFGFEQVMGQPYPQYFNLPGTKSTNKE